MNCLKDYVGIRGYTVTPASGQFINQLPGISLKSIQSIANSEQVTALAVWNDVQERAWRRISNDFMIAMRAKYCLKKDTDTDAIICDDKALFLRAWTWVLGAELMSEQSYSERLNIFTTINRGRGEELRATFTGEYENALEDLMPAIEWKEPEMNLPKMFSRVERLP